MSLGVALAGGGLKGLAHIGALQALEELGVKIDYLSGTSSGSMFATFYAMGYKTDEIKEKTMKYYKMLTKIEKKPIFKAGFYNIKVDYGETSKYYSAKTFDNVSVLKYDACILYLLAKNN